MILSTHAVLGGAIGALIPTHPVIAFLSGFLSHFVLDAIPHWDYSIRSNLQNVQTGRSFQKKDLFVDIAKVSIDALVGFLIVYYAFSGDQDLSLYLSSSIFFGAFGAMVPDGLQFVYYGLKFSFLERLQKFHIAIHSKISLNSQPIIGPALQCVLAISIIMCVRVIVF